MDANMSHHGDWVVLAAERSRAVGIDVMTTFLEARGSRREDPNEFLSTLRSTLTAEEWALLQGCETDEERLLEFFHFWAVKESYIKATGHGLGFEVQRINVSYPQGRTAARTPVLQIDGARLDGWEFATYMLDERHVIAVATPKTDQASTVALPLDIIGSIEQLVPGE
mmetsp:Transcript_14973/g.35251  ORF Transcript_14973/g.35251 Transcript_14973/m.35251 type:complete len:168 (-) Transcript_14973:998-1501(-)